MVVRTRPPRGTSASDPVRRSRDDIAPFLEDAAHFSGGHAAGLALVTSEREIADLLRSGVKVLPIGAQSSLTGGATPMGEVVASTARLNRIVEIGEDFVRVQAGVALAALDEALARANRYYPPAPTFTGAFVGGIVATNAAGAATFKYGTTRKWVKALTIVLPSGDVLDVERGAVRAEAGLFRIELGDLMVEVVAPHYRLPQVPKVSAGYFSAPDMELIDLFIGSEGTLGIVTEVTLGVLPFRPVSCLALITLDDQAIALTLAGALRDAARETWRRHDPRGLDISAIEYLDARSLDLLRQDAADARNGVDLPSDARAALLVTLELGSGMDADRAFDEIGRCRQTDAPDTPLVRFCRMLDDRGLLDRTDIALPGNHTRTRQMTALREGVPEAVNRRVGIARRTIDPRIEKIAADVIVPFDRLGSLFSWLDRHVAPSFDLVVWGHLSDGNLHPNVIARSQAEAETAKAAFLELGREVIRLGGSPLAEHGVGRNPVKQQLLRELYGESGIEEMRRIKRALDPDGVLAPGVLFPSGQP